MPAPPTSRAEQIAKLESDLKLFNRTIKVTLAKQPTGLVGNRPSYFDTVHKVASDPSTNGIEITDLRVQFEIKKNLGKEPNTCTLTITNLSRSTRADLKASKPLYAILQAGYNGEARHLFSGNVTYAFSKHNGTDWETKLQIGDGLRAFSHARLSKSYAKPITVQQVLADAAASMGLRLPPEVEQSPELRQALATGISVHGPTRDTLTKLLAPYGVGWSIQNGRLQILADEQVSDSTAIVVNQEAGLINSPEHSIPAKPGDPSDLTFENLIFPEINPGGMVDMDAQDTKGIYKVQDVTHKGDTHGDEWTTSVKALPLGQSKRKGKRR